VRGLAHPLRRDAEVRLELRDRELDRVLVHAQLQVLRRLQLLEVRLLVARVPRCTCSAERIAAVRSERISALNP
jgi:hypothetical protein